MTRRTMTRCMMKRRAMKPHRLYILAAFFFCAVFIGRAADNSWMQHVPDEDRKRSNPFAKQQDAIAAGAKIFADHCAKCHGSDALGRGKKPSLRSKEVQEAADGEIFWLLRNGDLRRGMPSWSSLPEPSRWQVVTYIKSLGEAAPGDTANSQKGN
jgi:mono/diheme cytochrome c family protein